MKEMFNRRSFIHKSTMGSAIFAGLPLISFGKVKYGQFLQDDKIQYSDTFPSQDIESVKEIVGASHARFDRVKEMVIERPELAKAVYDWGFGDWESALGAASHMGRRDIAEFLIEHGARPNIFTFAMLGQLGPIKSIINANPGIQNTNGPHGITLLSHAKSGLRSDTLSSDLKIEIQAVIEYLESLGDANENDFSLEISRDEQEMYLGKYVFGKEDNDCFNVKLNMRGMLSIARGEDFGRALLRVGNHIFAPGGAPSVRIIFKVADEKVISVTVHDPIPLVTAVKV